jgi:hypothetical protein
MEGKNRSIDRNERKDEREGGRGGLRRRYPFPRTHLVNRLLQTTGWHGSSAARGRKEGRKDGRKVGWVTNDLTNAINVKHLHHHQWQTLTSSSMPTTKSDVTNIRHHQHMYINVSHVHRRQ